MQNTPIDAVSSGAASQSTGPVTASDVMRLIYESGGAQPGDDPFKLFDAQRLSQKEWKRLEQLLDEHKEKLTDVERNAIRESATPTSWSW